VSRSSQWEESGVLLALWRAFLNELLRTHAEAWLAIFDFIEGWYNPRRRYSALDYRSPIAYENRELVQV
jgi:transposase InsO family protein